MTNKPPVLAIQIIGIGESRIQILEKILCLLATKNGMDLRIQRIDSLDGILSFDLQSIPAVAIDQQVIFEYSGETEAAIYTKLSEGLSAHFPRPSSSRPQQGDTPSSSGLIW